MSTDAAKQRPDLAHHFWTAKDGSTYCYRCGFVSEPGKPGTTCPVATAEAGVSARPVGYYPDLDSLETDDG